VDMLDSDSDWEMEDTCNDRSTRCYESMSDRSDTEDDYYSDNAVEEVSWMQSCVDAETWKFTAAGVQKSTRIRYQQRPLK
jgi:hypothetical protein